MSSFVYVYICFSGVMVCSILCFMFHVTMLFVLCCLSLCVYIVVLYVLLLVVFIFIIDL